MPSTDYRLQCRCGSVAGTVARAASVTRITCYCRDCQAYAHALSNPAAILDDLGGTDIVATLQQHVRLTQGIQALACLLLSERGLLRWYASCCNTPIANTARNHKLSYVGLVHTCLAPSQQSLAAAFGPTSMPINTKFAKAKLGASAFAALPTIARIFLSVARARVDGSFKQSPFFAASEGTPVVAARVLSAAERDQAMNAV